MTLSTTTIRYSYAGNDSTTAFSYPRYFLADADLKVFLRVDATGVETEQTITTHYTVSGAGVSSGGTVTMVTPPATGETLIIYRDPEATQDLDLEENGAFPAAEAEKRLDKLTMIAQRLIDRLDRAVALTDAYNATFNPALPSTITANAVLAFDSDGEGFTNGPTTTEITDAESNATAAAASADAASDSATAAANSETAAGNSATAAADSAASVAISVSGSFASPNDIVAETGIAGLSSSYNQTVYVQGDGGAVDITANPQIEAPSNDGQRLRLVGCSDTNTLLLENGNGLVMKGNKTLGLNDTIDFEASNSQWLEVGRNS